MQGYGLCLWRLGRWEEAEPVFERLLWLSPSDNQGVGSTKPVAVVRGCEPRFATRGGSVGQLDLERCLIRHRLERRQFRVRRLEDRAVHPHVFMRGVPDARHDSVAPPDAGKELQAALAVAHGTLTDDRGRTDGEEVDGRAWHPFTRPTPDDAAQAHDAHRQHEVAR